MATRALGAKAQAIRETIAELCENPPNAPELVEEVSERVRRVVPFDTGAWMVTDPESQLPTSMAKTGGHPELHFAYGKSEFLESKGDINTFEEMLSLGRTATALSLVTDGDLASSKRYRDIHMRFGLHDELRLVARSANQTWALGCVSRGTDLPDFTEDEVRWVASIADHLGRGVRTALSRPTQTTETVRAPGMLVIGESLTVEAATGEAERWLSTLDTAGPGMLPPAVYGVALQAQANHLGTGADRAARVRVQMRGGGWLLVHADVLNGVGPAASKVAVVLEPADRAALLPLLLALHGLTERERDVAELLVAGLSTDEVAARLVISRHTVRDHVKAIFAKVGVTSRPELTAALGLAA